VQHRAITDSRLHHDAAPLRQPAVLLRTRRAPPRGVNINVNMLAQSTKEPSLNFWLWSGSGAVAQATQPSQVIPRVLAICAALLGPALFGSSALPSATPLLCQ